jgi:tetratricopeptide (TPR) repeat protein
MEERGAVIARVRELYEQGLFLQAHSVACTLGPLRDWSGTDAVLAGRLAAHLGGTRMGGALIVRAWRRHRQDPEATYYMASALRNRRGPWVAWRFLQDHPLPPAANTAVTGDWHALAAALHADFRDFETADMLLARAEEMNPGDPWSVVVRSEILAAQDRYEEALEVARAAAARRDDYMPAIRRLSQLLVDLGRYEEALAVLAPAERRLESGALSASLVQLLLQLDRIDEVEPALARGLERSPLAEKELVAWLAAARCEIARERRDFESAVNHARACGSPFHAIIAEHLSRALAGGEHERVRLAVPYERQYHLTCAPSSLAAITRFWSRPADALEMARAVTYDGTPGHRARAWLSGVGWRTCEFRATDEAARALLSRGVPFTLVTVQPGSAHEQVVTGFDAAAGTWLIHDPGRPFEQEVVAAALIEGQSPFGVRGLALLPPEEASRLEGIELPDAHVFDTLYRLDRALEAHDRETAAACARHLAEAAPDHVLTLSARRRLAAYDGDTVTLLECAEIVSARFPDCIPEITARVGALHDLGRHAEAAALVEASCRDRRLAPLLLERHAQHLSDDARRMPEALRLMRRALRTRPMEPAVLSIAAGVYWRAGRLEESLALRRFAACLDDTQEWLVTSYFSAARHLGQSVDALAWLRRRHARHGAASTHPVRTLFWALEELGLADDGFERLEEALGRSPDGDLRVWAAETYARYGRDDRARELLEQAQGRSRPAVWLRAAARLAAARGDLEEALGLWQRVQSSEPLAVDAHREIAALLAAQQGHAAALDHLRRTTESFPHHVGLQALHYEWARREGAAEGAVVLRRMIANLPRDAWSRRELAVVLADQREIDAALAELEEARALEPVNASLFSVSGYVLVAGGRVDEARDDYRKAVRLDVNLTAAVNGLLSLPLPADARREDLNVVHAEMVAQRLNGDSLSSYHRHARGLLPPEAVRASLRAALDARPDIWQTWSTYAAQLRHMNRLEEAAGSIAEACERFPLVAPLWMDRAYVARVRGRTEDEKHALETALAAGADWAHAARRLAELHEEHADPAAARRRLEQAVARAPLDARNHAGLAERLWNAGEREAAIARLERAVDLAPEATDLWSLLHEWHSEQGGPERTVARARARAEARPGDASCWMVLARLLNQPETRDQALAALDRAIEAAPHVAEAYDIKAEFLAEAGRFEDARAACRAPAWGAHRPRELRGREAWIEFARGDVESAIRLMRAIVEHEADYFWGWSRLADWYEQTNAMAGYLYASEHLARIAPHHAPSLGYRGDALRRHGRLAEACADFERALELDPRYAYGCNSLAEVHLDGKRYAEALAVLDRYGAQAHDDHSDVLRIAALDALSRIQDAGDVLRRMLSDPEARPAAIEHVVTRVGSTRWREEADGILAAACTASAPSRIARLAVISAGARSFWKECRRRLDLLPHGSETWRLAAEAYVDQITKGGRTIALRELVQAHRDELRATPDLWGGVGYAYSTLGADQDAVEWMADWQARAGVAPWMLLNLALSLRRRKQMEECVAVHRAALKLSTDSASARHAAWLAVDEALAGRLGEADALLADRTPANDYDRFLHILGEAVVETGRGRRPFRWFRGQMAEARATLPDYGHNSELDAAYRAAVWRVARRNGGIWGLLWAALRLLHDRQ